MQGMHRIFKFSFTRIIIAQLILWMWVNSSESCKSTLRAIVWHLKQELFRKQNIYNCLDGG